MNIWELVETRSQKIAQSQIKREFESATLETSLILAGEQARVIIESARVSRTVLATFRRIEWPRERALVVAAPDPFDILGRLKPFEIFGDDLERKFYLNSEESVTLVECLERGWFGRLEMYEDARNEENAVGDFYGADGFESPQLYEIEDSQLRGMWMPGWIHQTHDLNYDPSIQNWPFCRADEAPTALLALDESEFLEFLKQEKANPNGVFEFAQKWENWDFEARRAWLPPLERQIEDEISPVLRWLARCGEPLADRILAGFSKNRRDSEIFARCPRFLQSGGETVPKIEPTLLFRGHQSPLEKLWPAIRAAFADEIEALAPLRDNLHPSVALWCRFRGAYLAPFAPATSRHEQAEAMNSLSDWFKGKTGQNLGDWI